MGLVFDAIAFKQNHIKMYAAVVHLADLDHLVIDTWHHKNVTGRRGYQRNPDHKRITRIADYFVNKKAIMPVAGLLNVRDKGQMRFRNGKLTIPDGVEVWVVDMQHRLHGLRKARDRRLLKSAEFQFPVVITEGLSQLEEAAQFYIVNTKAKKMDVALTRRLLIENNVVRDIADVKPWQIPAIQATIDLNTKIKNNPWYHAIRQPNEEKLQDHVATEKSFVPSLRLLFMAREYKNGHGMAKRLARLWETIRDIIPAVFEEPSKYVIQRTPGMFAFNFFLAPALLRSCKDTELGKKLRGLAQLGSEFWKRTNKRGARRFGSGMGGVGQLASYLRKYIQA